MSDNVIKFRKIEKKPDPKQPRKKPELPGWLPWVGLIVVALAIYGLQRAGIFGGQ
ncbi:hypothetical protein [Devosia sp.]|uniref:hypothetical protein n=1 Tax=Devosia sp. TaxID=1871048 RepID=UPI00326398AF